MATRRRTTKTPKTSKTSSKVPKNGRPRKRTGRPSLISEERIAILTEAICDGQTQDVAAKLARIDPRTFGLWLAKGRKLRVDVVENGAELPEDGELYLRLIQDYENAEALAHAESVDHVRRAASETWQAAAWWLERRYPETYARRVNVRHGGDDAAPPIAVEQRQAVVARLTENEDVVEAVAGLLEEVDETDPTFDDEEGGEHGGA